jgi:hypothetical protein
VTESSRGVVVNMASLNSPGLIESNDESSYITGIDLVVDGGMRVW